MEQAQVNFERRQELEEPRALPSQPTIRRQVAGEPARRQGGQRGQGGRYGGHRDQLMAAAASVVWMAGFVQSIMDEITGDEGDNL
jgi:hypothetical protein